MLKSLLTLSCNKSRLHSNGLRCLSLELQMLMMNRVSVRKIEGEERMQISLKFINNESHPQHRVPRQFNMDRFQSEEIEKTLSRLQGNISKLFNKKKGKKNKNKSGGESQSEEVEEYIVPITLIDQQGNAIENGLSNKDAWTNGSSLHVKDHDYDVVINPPTVNSLSLPKSSIMAGFPIEPTIDAEFVNLSHCKFAWYKEEKLPLENEHASKRLKEDYIWKELHQGRIYVPSNADVGCRLKVICHPSDHERDGEPAEAISKTEVTAGPDNCPFDNRHQHTQQYTNDEQVRVMSYNILADVYADSEFSRNTLFPYCPPYALDINYRRQLLLKEIIGFKADVICMQEVEQKLFVRTLLPSLERQGYQGHLKIKTGQVAEGTATFYRTDKFKIVGQHDVGLNDLLKNDAVHATLLEKINSKEQLKEKILQRTTAVQVSVLEHVSDPSRRVLVATTHLYFHPRAPHIRIIQTFLCMLHIESILQEYEQKGEVRPTVVFCGDLNSYPEGGVHQLLKNKHIPSHHADWYAGGIDEFIDGMELRHNLNLTSACGYPRYTNFVTGFSGCLDYIYTEPSKLDTLRVIPMPSHEEVTQYTALPNPVFPSDHLAIICDLAWT